MAIPQHAPALLPDRHARPGPDGAAGQLHVGHGGQRDGVQHGLDLRHLQGLHPPERIGPAPALDGPVRHVLRHGRSRSPRPTWRRSSTTSWTSLQLVFGFVNAPLFATFLLGMFWKRTTGHGAFTGLLAGTASAAVFHGLTLPAGERIGIKGAGYHGIALRRSPTRWPRTSGWRSSPGRSASW